MITSDDLRGIGFDVEDGVARRREEAISEPPRGILAGIDPSLRNVGAAALDVEARVARVDHRRLPKSLPKGHVARIDKEADFLNLRLGELRGFVAEFVDGVRTASPRSFLSVQTLVEGAYFRGSSAANASHIVRYGIAVGTVAATAARFSTVEIVPADWTWRVLTGRQKGGATKRERWQGARAVLDGLGIEWPENLGAPESITDDSPDEHRADALALCAARARRWI
jgi:hypothetical protein